MSILIIENSFHRADFKCFIFGVNRDYNLVYRGQQVLLIARFYVPYVVSARLRDLADYAVFFAAVRVEYLTADKVVDKLSAVGKRNIVTENINRFTAK